MAVCTAAAALSAFAYWLGYCEKNSAAYADKREKQFFETDAGNGNYTYAGYVAGCVNGAWCAMQVSLALYEACGDVDSAKHLLYGVYPYYNCGQVWDAAPGSAKFRRGAGIPKPGDIIIFTNNGISRDHTGMVYAVDETYVYTYEGNSSNRCRKRSYLLTDAWIYGYVRPPYADGKDYITKIELYGKLIYSDTGLHELSKGCAGPEVKTIQRIAYARGVDRTLVVDGSFGKATKTAVIVLQKQLDLVQDGVVGKNTWKALLTQLE